MAEQLFLRLAEQAEHADAVVLSSDGRVLRSSGRVSLVAAASLAEGRRLSVLIPASDVVTFAAAIPKAGAARIRSLLPFSLEDNVATDIEDLHFAAGRTQPDGQVAASIIAKSVLESWLAGFRDAALQPQAVYAESDGVPDTPATVNLVIEGEAIMGRLPGQPPFRVEHVTLKDAWDLLVGETEDDGGPSHVMVYGAADDIAARGRELDELGQSTTDVEIREFRDGSLALLAATLLSGTGTNLLQGDYAPRSSIKALLQPWYPTAGLAAALGAVLVLSTAAEFVRLDRAEVALSDEATALCSRLGVAQLSQCSAEVERRLTSAGESASSTGASFLAALSTIAAAAGGATLDTLSYRNNVLDLSMRVPGVAELDAFSQRVESTRRFEVRTLSNTPEDEGLRSRLQVVGTQ